MKNSTENNYELPAVWQWSQASDGKRATLNRPVSGATHDQSLPRGNQPLQLYSLNTPNGIKINIMLKELAQQGIEQAKFDAYKINIAEGDQFGSDYVALNPNSKIPTLLDCSGESDTVIFESGAILLYLADKFKYFIPAEQSKERAECLSWLMWQMGSAPYIGGGFGHFYHYAPKPLEYPVNRFTMEAKRQLDVLDKHLAASEYISGSDYSIADMAIWPWYGQLVLGKLYDAAEFLNVIEYTNLMRWAKTIAARPAVQAAIEMDLQEIK